MAALILGLAGVGVLAGWSPLTLSAVVVLSISASLLGAASYGLASVYTKARVRDASPLGLAAGSQLAASLLLLPLTPFTLPPAPPSTSVMLVVLVLGLVCTALAYLLYFRLVIDVGPVKALTVTFLVPVFGVTWGALLLGETITWSTVAGCVIILVSTALVTGVGLRPSETAPSKPEVPAAADEKA